MIWIHGHLDSSFEVDWHDFHRAFRRRSVDSETVLTTDFKVLAMYSFDVEVFNAFTRNFHKFSISISEASLDL